MDGMIMLDGTMFDSMLGRCSDLFTGTADELFDIMTDSEVMLSSWQGVASDKFRESLSLEIDSLLNCLNEISRIMVRIEDIAINIIDLKHRIGEALG